jgi:hypothetical protein
MRTADAGRLLALAALLGTLAGACATKDGTDDPLKNTKKLLVEGHVSLYKNGAFRVPRTTIALIPPGPDALELIGEFMGIRARQSLQKSLKQAAQSVYVVSEGTRLSFRAAADVRDGGDADAYFIRKHVRDNGVVLVYRSSALGKRIVGKPWERFKADFAADPTAGAALTNATDSAGAQLAAASPGGVRLAKTSGAAAADLARSGIRRSGAAFDDALDRFVKGYATVPTEMKKRAREAGEQFSSAGFAEAGRNANETRESSSHAVVDLFATAQNGYWSGVTEDFHKAGREFDGAYQTTGVSLAALKSLRWVLQGLLGDAVIVPAAKMTAASLGYIGVNMVAFPTIVVVREGAAVAQLAVEASWDAGRSVYDLTAPTGIAALASVYALADAIGSLTAAGATLAVGETAGYGEAALAETASVVVKGAGDVGGKSIDYIGVPLASAGVAVGRGAVGVVVGSAGASSGGALAVAGETASVSARAFGHVLAGTAVVGGTSASVAAAGGYAAYELSQAVVVPSGYEFAGGMVVSYGTLSHLSAQTILAAADCSYMVLSLEGPRWVLYAVKGNLGRGDDLLPGTVLDLKKMHEAGEEIYAIPATSAEMGAVVNSLYDDLPTLRPGPGRPLTTTP